MAKMFYTLEEAAQKLGVQQDEVMGMVESGQLSEFRDGDDLRFKVEQVDLMSSGDDVDDMIPLVDDADESALGIALEDSGPSGGSGIEIDETVVDLGATQQAKEASGISIFEADEFDQADASADTIITDSPVGGDFQMESSGSGLLDLTREADDTSLGADLLEDVYADSEETSGSSGLFEETTAASDVSSAFPEAQAAGGAVMAVEMVEGGASGASGGAVLGMFLVTAATLAAVLMTLVGDGTNPLMDVFQQASPLIWGGACLGLILIFAAIGFVVGRSK